MPVGEVGPSIADLKNRVIFLLERLTIGLRYYSSLLTCGCQADLPKLLDLELFPPAVAPPGHSFLVMILLGDEPGTGNEQVWPLSQFFLFPFSKTSLICLLSLFGKHYILSSVLPSNSLVSVSDPSRSLDQLTSYIASGTTEIHGHCQVFLARCGGPRTASRTIDATILDCALIENILFTLILKSPQNGISQTWE